MALPDRKRLLGLSEETTCYLAADAVRGQKPLVDVIVRRPWFTTRPDIRNFLMPSTGPKRLKGFDVGSLQ